MKYTILIIAILFSSCYLSEELPPDQTVWEYDLPVNVNLDQEALLSLDTRIKINDFERIRGLTIIKDGKLVFENYYSENSRYTLNALGGTSMAITIAAIAIAEEKGFLSFDDKIEDYLPEYADIFEDDNNKTFITIRHLILNKSGLPWSISDLFDIQTTNDWVRYVLEKSMQAPAGLQFNFNNACGLILAKIIENGSGQSFQGFIEENIFQPLGIINVSIKQDSQGNFDGAFGISVSLLDLTKIGYLMLEEGIWNGRRVIDPNFVDQATSIQTNVSGTYNAGYSWRRFGSDFENFFGINHEDIYFITGELGQHLYIIPSKNLIVCIDAENYFFGFGNPSLNLLAEISYMIQ